MTLNWSALVSEPVRSCALPQRVGGHGAIERPFHVLGGNRRAVMELGVLAQLEGDLQPVGADFVALGQFASDLVEVEDPVAVELLAAERDEPVVGRELQAEGLAGRARHGGVEGVDAGARDMAQRLGACLRERRRQGRTCRRGRPQRQGTEAHASVNLSPIDASR